MINNNLGNKMTPIEMTDQAKAVTIAVDDLIYAAKNLAEYASYAEIIGGISYNRSAIRKFCDEVFDALKKLPEDENFERSIKPTIDKIVELGTYAAETQELTYAHERIYKLLKENDRLTAGIIHLDNIIDKLEDYRKTYCTAMPGSDEEFNNVIAGFDMAVKVVKNAK